MSFECQGNPLFKDREHPGKFMHAQGCDGEAKWRATSPLRSIVAITSDKCLDWFDNYDSKVKVEKLTELNVNDVTPDALV